MCSPEPFIESKTTQNRQSDTVSPPKLEFFTTLATSKRIFIVSIVFSMKFSTRNSVLTLKSDHKLSPERLFAAKMTIFRTKHNFLHSLCSPLVEDFTQTVPNHREMIDFIITFQVVLKKSQKNR